MNGIVVYYSWTGNTEIVAREIAKALKIDIRSLKEVKERKAAAGFMGAAFRALMGAKSRLRDVNYNLEGYNTVFLGTPIWAWHTTPAINTFVHYADFQQKKVFLFVTSSSGKTTRPFESLSKRVQKRRGIVTGSFSFKTEFNKNPEPDDVKPLIIEWLKTLDLK